MSIPNDAAKFLACLDTEATTFTFQTFDDVENGEGKKRKDRRLVRVLTGTLAEHAPELIQLNDDGAGIFVTVNETDGKGRKAENIVRVRALFVDLDGAPLAPVISNGLTPTVVLETSPGRWHAYWRVDEFPLDKFSEFQKSLIKRFNSDRSVHDLPRVMRLPGFQNRKRELPFLVRIESINTRASYSVADFLHQSPLSTPAHLRKYKSEGRGLSVDEPSRWQKVNTEALAKLDDWVPALFNHAVKNASGVYRISSEALGREHEEDLSISPQGIKDFGVHDLGDARGGKRSPLDLVKEYGAVKDLEQAFEWLSIRIWKHEETKAEVTISATPFAWIDSTQIPKRQWLYRPHYVRQFISLTVSTGGVGKSSLVIVEALAMVSGRPLLGTKPARPLSVWYWNGEDPKDELQRRIAAAVKHYGIKSEDIENRLFVDSGRTMPIVIAEDTRRDTRVAEPVIAEVIKTIRKNRIEVLIIDPFVTCHRVSENDNGAVERVAKAWAHIAEETNCSVMLVHHSRKTGSGEGVTVDDGRGASSLLAAARTARTLNTMRDKEAENAEIDERDRRLYFRSEIGKANLTRPAEDADWFKIVSVDLENAGDDADWYDSDEVGVVTQWDYPKVETPEITLLDVQRVQNEMRKAGPWREDQRSKNEPWAGIPIAQALEIDLSRRPQIRVVVNLIRDLLQSGALKRVEKKDGTRKPRTYVEVGDAPVMQLQHENALDCS